MTRSAKSAAGPGNMRVAARTPAAGGRALARCSRLRLALLVLFLALLRPAGWAAESASVPAEVGRKLYQNRCAKCHQMYDPAKYSDVQWQAWMDKMGKKARLRAAEKQMVMRYVEETLRTSVRPTSQKTEARHEPAPARRQAPSQQ